MALVKAFGWIDRTQMVADVKHVSPGAGQPNEFDHLRVTRALEHRQRYRYVTPSVVGVDGGYRIEAPCCSRNVDPEGGKIDVALMLFDERRAEWRLFRRDHARNSWELHSTYARLGALLDGLNADPGREFWQ